MSLEAQLQTLTAVMTQTNQLLAALLERSPAAEAVVLETRPAAPAPQPAAEQKPAGREPDVEVDASGLPWDERIHASSRAQNADGTWRRRKNVSDEEFNAIASQINPKQVPLDEAALESRMDVIGQNGNDGLHYAEQQDDPTDALSGGEGFAQDDPTPASETVDTPASEPESSDGPMSEFDAPPAADDDEPALTLDDIRRISLAASKEKGKDYVWEVLKKFGVTGLPQLKVEDYRAYVNALKG